MATLWLSYGCCYSCCISKEHTQNYGIIHKEIRNKTQVHHLMSDEVTFVTKSTQTFIIFIKIHSFVSPLIFN